MLDSKDIEKFALTQFDDLIGKHSYRGTEITHEAGMTRIDYFKNNIGIEIEIDVRESAAFLLIARLQNGKLPDGYYISHGRT